MGDIGLVTALSSPVRGRLYSCVADASEPLTREQAAKATDISRALAAYHLDMLVRLGLLEAEYRRQGRGRPLKVYRRAATEFTLGAPPRDYRRLAAILAEAVEPGRAAGPARRAGVEARTGANVAAELRALGYEPVETEPGVLRLRNCPFDAVAKRCTEIVCGVNLAFLEGLLEGRARTRLVPAPGMCCVEVLL